MKKLLWILLLIPSLCFSATGDIQTIGGKVDTAITSIAGKAGTAIATICGKNYTDGDSGASCPAEGSPDLENATHDNQSVIGNSTTNQYAGVIFQDTVNRSICRYCTIMDRITGDISGYTYTAKVWSLDGSNNLNAVITNGTSANVSGNNDWSRSGSTWACWTWSTPPTMTANTPYAITIEQNTISASNYAGVAFVDGSTSSTIANLLHADSSGTTTIRTDKESTVRIYYYD